MNVEAMTWLVMIGLPCWGMIWVIRSVLTAPAWPWQLSLGRHAIGQMVYAYRPLLVMPVVALIFVGKSSMTSYWGTCSPMQPICSRHVPASAAPAKMQPPVKAA